MNDNLRAYKYYIATTALNKNHYSILCDDVFHNMFVNKDIKREFKYINITEEEIKNMPPPLILTKENIDCIYFSELNSKFFLLLIQHNNYYYYIKDIINNNEDIKSTISISTDFLSIINVISKSDKKLLEFVKYDDFIKKIINKKKSKSKEKNSIPFDKNSLYPFDIINTNTLNNYIKNLKSELCLTNMFKITDELLSSIDTYEHINYISIYNNLNIKNLLWLEKFPNLEYIVLYDIDKLNNYNVLLPENNKINTIEINNCNNIDSLIVFNTLNSINNVIKNIIINNEKFKTQENEYTSILSDEQWLELQKMPLETLYFSSPDITNECINNFIQNILSLNKIFIHPKVYSNIRQNINTGFENEEIQFTSIFNKNDNFIVNRDIKFSNLNLKQEPYSETFLRKMRELNKIK